MAVEQVRSPSPSRRLDNDGDVANNASAAQRVPLTPPFVFAQAPSSPLAKTLLSAETALKRVPEEFKSRAACDEPRQAPRGLVEGRQRPGGRSSYGEGGLVARRLQELAVVAGRT
jgi:hypothetical protein